MGTMLVTQSPESITMPVVQPEAYRDSTAWMATYKAEVLKVSNMIWVIFSQLALRVQEGLGQQHRVLSGAAHSSL